MALPLNYTASVTLPVSVQESFAYHDRPGCLNRLIPPWESVRLEKSDQSLAVGSKVVLVTRLMGIPLRWVAEHTRYEPPTLFADTQRSGPFAQWDHEHRFESLQADVSRMTDQIEYRLPGGAVGRLLGGWKARQTIEAMFAYRHRITRDDLRLTARLPTTPKTVAVSGATGLVGSNLCALLTLLGHHTKAIVRTRTDREDQIAIWSDPAEADKLDDVDVVIHLAGKSIADGRWTSAVKEEIRDSRVEKTRQLCETLARRSKKPSVLLCASASGIYGDRGDELLDESSDQGSDFLAEVAGEWESACQPAIDAGIRVVNLRLGIVISPKGGALTKMLLPAKLLGGSLGSGQQWWSWIALDDVLGGIYHAMQRDELSGPMNLVSPHPIRNADFAKTLGRVLGRPALFPAPAFALRTALGEMADALLLSSCRVIPSRLESSGYTFRFTDLADQLRYCLGKERLQSET
ncbi:MAG: TIGR01777 family oxidoreductase [Planctomycetota bacterium]